MDLNIHIAHQWVLAAQISGALIVGFILGCIYTNWKRDTFA